MLLSLKYQSYFTTDFIARFLNLKLYALIRTIYLHKINTYLIYHTYPWLQYNNTISFQAEKSLPFIQPFSSFFSHMLIGRKPVCEISGLDWVWKVCHSCFLWKQQGENHVLQQVGSKEYLQVYCRLALTLNTTYPKQYSAAARTIYSLILLE